MKYSVWQEAANSLITILVIGFLVTTLPGTSLVLAYLVGALFSTLGSIGYRLRAL